MAGRALACKIMRRPRCLCLWLRPHRTPKLLMKVHAHTRRSRCSWGRSQPTQGAHGRPCACMRTPTAFRLLLHVHATTQGAHGAAGAAQSQREGAQQISVCMPLIRARTLLMGQLVADVRVHGMPCACMQAHTAPAWLMRVHANS